MRDMVQSYKSSELLILLTNDRYHVFHYFYPLLSQSKVRRSKIQSATINANPQIPLSLRFLTRINHTKYSCFDKSPMYLQFLIADVKIDLT